MSVSSEYFQLIDRHSQLGSHLALPPDMASPRSPADDDWHSTVDAVITSSVDNVWAIASNWLGFPRSCMVECLEGHVGVPGCVRRVQAYNSSIWVAERLTLIDPRRRLLAYDLVGGNSGLAVGYNAALQVMSAGASRTRVVWQFTFSAEQGNVDSVTAVVEEKVKAHITELEELAQES